MDVEGPLVGSSGLLHPILETMGCRINGQDLTSPCSKWPRPKAAPERATAPPRRKEFRQACGEPAGRQTPVRCGPGSELRSPPPDFLAPSTGMGARSPAA